MKLYWFCKQLLERQLRVALVMYECSLPSEYMHACDTKATSEISKFLAYNDLSLLRNLKASTNILLNFYYVPDAVVGTATAVTEID